MRASLLLAKVPVASFPVRLLARNAAVARNFASAADHHWNVHARAAAVEALWKDAHECVLQAGNPLGISFMCPGCVLHSMMERASPRTLILKDCHSQNALYAFTVMVRSPKYPGMEGLVRT